MQGKTAAVSERDDAEIELPDEEQLLAEEAAAAATERRPPEEPDEMDYEEPEEENVGQWSPRPLEPEHVVGLDVIPEEEDARLLDLLRKKVRCPETCSLIWQSTHQRFVHFELCTN